jgi:hypothetical protein
MPGFKDYQDRFTPLPEEEKALRHAAVEALAFVQYCPRRGCRRARRCGVEDAATGRPACIVQIHDEWRADYERLLALATAIITADRRTPSPHADERALEEMAIGLVRAVLPLLPKSARNARDWIAHYENPPPPAPPVDAALVLARIQLEQIRAEHRLAMEAIGR